MLLKNFKRYTSNPSTIDLDRGLDYSLVLKEINSLSNPATKVLNYIISVKGEEGEIQLMITDCLDFTLYSSTVNIYKGINELLTKEFLYRKDKSKYGYYLNLNKIK